MIKSILVFVLGMSLMNFAVAASPECPKGDIADVMTVAESLKATPKILENEELKAVGAMLTEMFGATFEKEATKVYIIDLGREEEKEMLLIVETDGKCVLYFAKLEKSVWNIIIQRTMAKEI